MTKRGPKTGKAAKRLPKGGPTMAQRAPGAALDATGQAEFDRLCGVLSSRGMLDRVDPRVIEIAADTYSEMQRAKAVVAEQGMSLETPNGAMQAHPLLSVINAHRMRLNKLHNDMGLTAASSKLAGVPESPDPSNGWESTLGIVG